MIHTLVNSKKGIVNIPRKEVDLTESFHEIDFMSVQNIDYGIIKINLQLFFSLFSIHLEENKILLETLNLFLENFGWILCNSQLDL